MAKIKGGERVVRKFKQLGSRNTSKRIGAALFIAGEMTQVEAQISITAGAVSGKHHKPSAPGEPPNADTHFLANNIETNQINDERVEVTSEAPYSVALEMGTSRMEARPFMAPAAAKIAPEAQRLVSLALREQARRKS